MVGADTYMEWIYRLSRKKQGIDIDTILLLSVRISHALYYPLLLTLLPSLLNFDFHVQFLEGVICYFYSFYHTV